MEANVSKILDPDLRRFAQAKHADEAQSVIVELEIESPQFTPREIVPRPRVPSHGQPSLFNLSTLAEEGGRAMDQLERELSALGLDQKVVRLNTAQAFVVLVKPKQLRAILRLPRVGAIRPNRTHHAPPR